MYVAGVSELVLLATTASELVGVTVLVGAGVLVAAGALVEAGALVAATDVEVAPPAISGTLRVTPYVAQRDLANSMVTV